MRVRRSEILTSFIHFPFLQVLKQADIDGPDGDVLTSTAYFDEEDVYHLPISDKKPYQGRARGRPRFKPEQLAMWAQERHEVRGAVDCCFIY